MEGVPTEITFHAVSHASHQPNRPQADKLRHLLPKTAAPRQASRMPPGARNQPSVSLAAGFRDRLHSTQAPRHEAIWARGLWHVRCFDTASFLVVPDHDVMGFVPA